MAAPDFWDEPAKAQKVMKEIKRIERTLEAFDEVEQLLSDVEVLADMASESGEADLVREAEETQERLLEKVDAMTT